MTDTAAQLAPGLPIHTTELTEPCPRKVLLRREGKIVGSMTSALYRGNLWHEAAALWHTTGERTDRAFCEKCALDAIPIVERKAKEERRPLTDAADASSGPVSAEVASLLFYYAGRIAPSRGKLIGVEVPIRMTLDFDGEPQEFETHLDMLWRTEHGTLTVWDWKTGEDDPTFPYLSRNLQFAVFWLAVRYGEALVDGEWVNFGEWPSMWWVHVNSLAPYGRGGSAMDRGSGEVREWKKGDLRPVERILIPANLDPAQEQNAMDLLGVRVRMMRAGLWPVNPDPVGCFLCESRRWCPNMSGSEDGN